MKQHQERDKLDVAPEPSPLPQVARPVRSASQRLRQRARADQPTDRVPLRESLPNDEPPVSASDSWADAGSTTPAVEGR